MDSDLGPEVAVPIDKPSAVASDQGAGPLGFVGTARNDAVEEAAGLTTLAGDEFGGGPMMPMVPGTWDGERRRKGEMRSEKRLVCQRKW